MIAPSPFFRQHYAVEAPRVDDQMFQQAYRVDPRINELLFDHAISLNVWHAGVMFRIASEIVIAEDYPSSSMDYSEHVGRRDHTPVLRADARKRLREVKRALGHDDYTLLEQHLVDDLPWRELARRRHVHAKTVKRWTIAALNRLAAI